MLLDRTFITMSAAIENTAAESPFSEEVSKLMGQGKRHLVCSEVVQAVKCFEEATQKLDDKYGSGSDECGEAYLFYGKALLELARAENGVLGNALKDDLEPKSGESSDEDEEQMETVGPKIKEMSPSSKEKIREDVQDAMAEKEGADAKEKGKEGKDQDKNKEEKQDKGEKTTDGYKTESGTKSDDTTSTEKTAKEEKEGKEGEKADKKEEMEGKEEGTEDKGDGQKAKEGTKEAEEGAREAEEGTKEAKEGTKEAEEGAKEGEEEKMEGEDEPMEEDEEENEEDINADGDQGGEDDPEATTTEGQEEDADVPTMQLAWEFLELARLVFLRQDQKSQLNLAEVHLKLGEIQLEQEQFVNAEEEFQKCLDIQLKHLEPDDRLIAETAYNIGLAYSLQPNYSKAKEFYSKALDVIKLKTARLETRIAEWESKSKGKGKATDDNPCVVDRKELEELQNLYPEIKARVDDAQEMINSASTQPESTTEEGFGTTAQDKSDVPASTIPVKQAATVIAVRRKRKPDEDSCSTSAQGTEAPVKKARQEDDHPAAPVRTENGHVPNGGVTSTEQK